MTWSLIIIATLKISDDNLSEGAKIQAVTEAKNSRISAFQPSPSYQTCGASSWSRGRDLEEKTCICGNPKQRGRATMRSPWMALFFFANISLAISPLRSGSSAAHGRVQAKRISRVRGLEGGSRGSWMCCARCGWRLCQNAGLLRGDIYSVRPRPTHPSRANSLFCSSVLPTAPFDPQVLLISRWCTNQPETSP